MLGFAKGGDLIQQNAHRPIVGAFDIRGCGGTRGNDRLSRPYLVIDAVFRSGASAPAPA
jgi:hypothetical protein